MRVVIESIPHKEQRYDTCGDYYQESDYGYDTLSIKVSELTDRREMLLVAIHELIEWALCQAKGVSIQAIDHFDIDGDHHGCAEPGDCSEAPYYTQHQIATGIERILAAEMGVDWTTYEKHIQELER